MQSYYIAFWNVENLFDVESSNRRPEWLQRALKGELKGWDQAVLDQKLERLGEIIRKMNGGLGPDVFGVCEIENEPVLEALAQRLASLGRGYEIAHADTKDGRGIDVAFFFDKAKFRFAATREESIFSHFILKRTATRDLFQVNLKTQAGDNTLVLIGNHWPARSGGRYESEPYRILAGETLSYWHMRIREEIDDDVAIIAMGDFNDEPFDRSLCEYALSYMSKAKVRNARNPTFFNLMWSMLGQRLGSHYFDNFPNLLDQFLISRGMILNQTPLRVRDGSPRIEAFAEMTRTGQYPGPVRFGRPFVNGRKDPDFDGTGYSDHFPISLIVEEP